MLPLKRIGVNEQFTMFVTRGPEQATHRAFRHIYFQLTYFRPLILIGGDLIQELH